MPRRYIKIRIDLLEDGRAWNAKRKSYGRTTGLGVNEFLSVLFDANETLRPREKMTDTAITKAVAEEFPGRKITISLLTGKRTINYYRNHYNAGRLTGTKPKIPSRRWTENGLVANGRTGRPLIPQPPESFPGEK